MMGPRRAAGREFDLAAVKLVAAREIREFLRGKPVWISTGSTLIGVVFAIVLPHVLASGRKTYQIAVTGHPPAAVTAAIQVATRSAGADAKLITVPRLRLRAVLRGEGGTADPVGAAAAGPTR
jgi:hypothetical protein